MGDGVLRNSELGSFFLLGILPTWANKRCLGIAIDGVGDAGRVAYWQCEAVSW